MYAYSYLLNYSDLPNSEKIHKTKPASSNYDRMVELLKQFYDDSNAVKFFDDNKVIFSNLKTYISTEAPKSRVEELLKETESYTGNKTKYYNKDIAYTTNITLFKMNAPFSRINDDDKIIFATVGPAFRAPRGSDDFSISSVIVIAVHEFLHQYLNTPVAKNMQQINSLTANLNKEDYVSKLYISKDMPWNRLIDENLVRAVEARIYDRVYGEGTGYKDIIEKETKAGFKNVNKAYEKLKEYENNRSKYSSIDDFMPELIESLLK
jgi:hypothetical protein